MVIVSVPPSETEVPRESEYTSRAPGKKVRNPLAQLPDVYMPLLP